MLDLRCGRRSGYESIDKKARDVKNLLVKATKQAPEDASTIIHIGYETLHGLEIEVLRDQKIIDLITTFDFKDKEVASVFCHSFQPRVFPEDWDFAETVRYFAFTHDPTSLLIDTVLTGRDGTTVEDGTHWLQDLKEYSEE